MTVDVVVCVCACMPTHIQTCTQTHKHIHTGACAHTHTHSHTIGNRAKVMNTPIFCLKCLLMPLPYKVKGSQRVWVIKLRVGIRRPKPHFPASALADLLSSETAGQNQGVVACPEQGLRRACGCWDTHLPPCTMLSPRATV